jgi:hypothetical protein
MIVHFGIIYILARGGGGVCEQPRIVPNWCVSYLAFSQLHTYGIIPYGSSTTTTILTCGHNTHHSNPSLPFLRKENSFGWVAVLVFRKDG